MLELVIHACARHMITFVPLSGVGSGRAGSRCHQAGRAGGPGIASPPPTAPSSTRSSARVITPASGTVSLLGPLR